MKVSRHRRIRRLLAGPTACLAVVAASGVSQPMPLSIERELYVMGTIARLITYDTSRERGLRRLEALVAAIEATEGELSTWKEASEVSRINRQPIGRPYPLSREMCRLLDEISFWSRETAAAFDPAIGRLTDAWDIHGRGRSPSSRALAAARRDAGLRWIEFDGSRCTLARRRNVGLDVGAFGKGEGLDRAARRADAAGGPWLIDLGGQVIASGRPPGSSGWPVAIAHPLHRGSALLTVELTEGSLSTSGGSEKDITVGGTRVGHILDPRTGRPAPFSGSVTVWHERALVADVLSTALYVMGPEAGVRWAEARGIATCYLVPSDVSPAAPRVVTSRAFAQRFGPITVNPDNHAAR